MNIHLDCEPNAQDNGDTRIKIFLILKLKIQKFNCIFFIYI